MTHPGIYVQGSRRRARDTEDVPTTITAFVGATLQGPTDAAALVRSFGDFTRIFGPHSSGGTLAHAVKLFFDNGGQEALICRVEPASGRASVRSFSGVPCRPTVPSTTGRGLSRARRRPYRHPERTFGSNGSRFELGSRPHGSSETLGFPSRGPRLNSLSAEKATESVTLQVQGIELLDIREEDT